MAIYDGPECPAKEEPTTLFQALSRLSELSYQIESLVSGNPPANILKDTGRAADMITEARNQVQDITERLDEVRRRLTAIGM